MLDFLHWVRDMEFDLIFAKAGIDLSDKRLLEIGAGSGYQLAKLQKITREALGVDIFESNYAEVRSANVVLYDGHHLPFADQSFDVIFSSNTLEHIPHLEEIHREFKRVLKPGGLCLHVVPTHHWKLRQLVGFYLLLPAMLWRRFFPSTKQTPSQAVEAAVLQTPEVTSNQGSKSIGQKLRNLFLPEHHGERGNVFSEYFYFRPRWWEKHFEDNNWTILKNEGLGLFYSPYAFLGQKLSASQRMQWSKWWGSSCQLFLIKPKEE
ncbi:class I SAM-dependent methyltransferase [Haliscomenobacter hydrossis]|uniref:Methyltransferase type 11 n=1 Tax=Haliscomenobacter hydrossis (strain ATCC 27775 / DSM 1100 / LMG 10767 / O) TaxID=760192 RepID=F4KX57_HALH1|nr:class I SAM-dependent methyltransferase [Haliscomenobacter hydrossis]AEE48285.1 Methyltransferase type 11 [Haliscomenobacter hydrossis DSM 1100]